MFQIPQSQARRVVILCGGPLGDADEVLRGIQNAEIIICANGGLDHASNLMIVPDIVVGDLDSANFETIQATRGQGAEIINFPTEKSKLDSELALERALKFSPEIIEIYGALGGRLDHTMGNIGILFKSPKDVHVVLVDTSYTPPCRTFLIHAGERHTFRNELGLKFSLITLEPEGAAITIVGSDYNLECKLVLPSSRCLGNRVKEKEAWIMAHQGTVICMLGYGDHPKK